ncbi:MAG: two-component regulator propeller domain-containing protein [Bacteroidota bacterium]|nr:two-component regulator propeller domain-containing protein [Bacteroidota bacterium]
MSQWPVKILCFLLFTTQATAQQLNFKTYTVEDGLVSNPVRRIYQDSKGFIWIGTWEGLSKYDGHKFTNFTTANGLSHNVVNDFHESIDGNLYVAENNGNTDILLKDAIVKKAAFRNVIINKFFITHHNKVIAATDTSGIYTIEKGKLVKPLQTYPQSTYNDFVALNDSLFIGGSDSSLRILNRHYDFFSEINQPKYHLVLRIYKDSKNRVWVGTNNGLKLVSYNQKNNQLHNFDLLHFPLNKSPLRTAVVRDMLEDVHGNLWIATMHGLVKIQSNNSWQVFLKKDGLPSDDITCVYQDIEKNIWIGTSLGLAKLVTKNDIQLYTTQNGLSSNPVDFMQPLSDDKFLIRTGTGMSLFNTTTENFYPIKSEHNYYYTGFIQNSRPLLFYGNNKFGKYDSIKRRINESLLPQPLNLVTYCSIIDSNGIIFDGTQNGLVIHAGDKAHLENKIPHRITAMLIDKRGYLWIGTWNNGLYRIHYRYAKNNSGSTEEVKNQVSLSVEDFSHLLPDKNIRSMLEDSKGHIWVGTRYQGLAQLRNNNNGGYAVEHFDLAIGLMSNSIRAIAEDKEGCIWLGSNLGIDKLIPADTSFQVFNFSRINNYFAHINAILPGDNNTFWSTTSTGLVKVVDGKSEKIAALPVYITSVNLGDKTFDYSKHHPETEVQLKYNQNQAAFEFSSPSFINEKQILYSYRLLGSADTMWSVPANLHNVSYASLQPGNYRFEVRTKGWNGQWGVSSAFQFAIRSPYWQTWWFYLLIGIFLVLLFYSFYLYRIRQVLRLQKVRNRIATDLHDDIGSTLTNISILSELTNKNLHQPEQAQKFLQRITEEVNASSQALDDIIWNVNNNNDTLEEMLVRMRRFSAELFDQSEIKCYLELQPDAAGKKISMEQRRDIYLLYKESLNNIYKHAGARTVWVDLKLSGNSFTMMIRDDGKGFNTEDITHRNGLKNLKIRVEKWGGKLLITSLAGKGSDIEIIMPLAD